MWRKIGKEEEVLKFLTYLNPPDNITAAKQRF
jgi:hypothetical protein